jgi:hypothetical protein
MILRYLILIFSSTEDQPRVWFKKASINDRWSGFQCCFENFSFKYGIHKQLVFPVTAKQKRDTTAVLFINCEAVDFIDIEILKIFPNLNNLKFWGPNIPILKNIFTVEMQMIQYLDLSEVMIKNLDAHVFDELVELQWISLERSGIEEILYPIFAKNEKLEIVDLTHNKIQTLHPNLFDGLPKLEEVRFFGIPYVNQNFKKKQMNTLNEELKPLFDNYEAKYGPNKIMELKLVSLFTFKPKQLLFKNMDLND